jgi:hypothetical protein
MLHLVRHLEWVAVAHLRHFCTFTTALQPCNHYPGRLRLAVHEEEIKPTLAKVTGKPERIIPEESYLYHRTRAV